MIIIIIGNTTHTFDGDELTSPESQAILFLQQQVKEKEEF